MKNKYKVGQKINFQEEIFETANDSGVATIVYVTSKKEGALLYEVKRHVVINSRGQDVTSNCGEENYLLLESEITGLVEEDN